MVIAVQKGLLTHSTLYLKQTRRSLGKIRGRNMPEGSAPIDASYALSAWIDTKFWHHMQDWRNRLYAPVIGTGYILH